MSITIVGEESNFNCPHCAEQMEDTIGAYVIPGHIGPRSVSKNYSDCGNCDGLFSVEKISETEFELTPVEGTYGDTRP
jgi:hypothetical protein